MARINLLPWRETLRKKRQQEFLAMMLGAVLVTALGLGYWHWFNQSLIENQNKRNDFIKREIAAVDEQIRQIEDLERTKNQLLSRMSVIQQLQSSRPEIVHLMDEMVTTLPEGAYLVNVKQVGRQVSIEGHAQSNARVSSYMRNIDLSQWLGNPQLKIIENKDKTDTGMSHFQMVANQINAAKGKEEE